MSVSRRQTFAAAGILCALVISAGLVFADDKPKSEAQPDMNKLMAPTTAGDGMDVMNSLIGEWKIDGTWLDGRPIHARTIYEPGVGKKFVDARTFVKQDDGTEYQRYHNIFGAKDGKLTCWNFTFDGSSDVSTWEVLGKKISSSKAMKSAADSSSTGVKPAASTLHQSIELVEPNKLHWLVAIETNGETKPIMDGYWVRESK